MKRSFLNTIKLLFLLPAIIPYFVFAINGKDLSFVEEKPNRYIFKNLGAILSIEKQSMQVVLLDLEGKVHFSEYHSPVFNLNDTCIQIKSGSSIISANENTTLLSIPASNNININLLVEKAGDYGFKLKYSLSNKKATNIAGSIVLDPVEEIYGFGEIWNKNLAQRGQTIEIWDKTGTPDECAWMPYYVSTRNYAFFINYGGKVKFNIGRDKADELQYELATNELEYTILIGDDVASCVQNFVALTGMPAKPPRWSFKPWFWLMSDPDIPGGNISTLRGEHFLEMVEKLEALDIPIGVTWLEPPWQNARTSFIPNTEFCPDLKGLIADVAKHGVKMLAWTVPYTSPEASNWDTAIKNDYLVKRPDGKTDKTEIKITSSGELEGTFYNQIDYYNPEAVKWWQQQIKESIDLGLKGFKLDAGQTLPIDGLLYGDRLGKDHHNSIALEYNKVFYESLKNKLGDDFLMIPRAAWIGSGAYTNFKWPGDLSGSFANNGLSSSVYSSLSLAFSGLPFVSTDIGGFVDQPAPEYVWIRWAQFGAMLPGMQTLHMPWWYSDEAKDHFRYLAWLHTDLIPYWETLGNEAHETGTPVCRPLVWDYQSDQETWYVDDEFTVGKYLLVAPFINPETKRNVYLPDGQWIDFWDENEVFEGKQKVRWSKGSKKNVYKFPLYIKEGAVIPLEIKNDVSGFGTKYSEEFITLAMWPEKGAENEFVLNDREGPVSIVTNWETNDNFTIKRGESSKDYLFRIHLKKGLSPSKVVANNLLKQFEDINSFQQSKSDGWYFDQDAQKLWIKKYSDIKSGVLKLKITI
jgi:alpha-D-xyloside xylohydrolase